MKRIISIQALAVVAMALTSGCGGDQIRSTGSVGDVPQWAMTPPAACGVGIAKHRGDLGTAQQSAEARGRDSLARQLETRVQSMIKDYRQSGETGGKDFTEEMTTIVSRQLVNTTLIGTGTRMTHLSGDNPQQYFALVCLQPEAFAGAFERMKDLSGKQRAALKARAEAEFKDLDEQLERLND